MIAAVFEKKFITLYPQNRFRIKNMNSLITGASGFIGSFLVEKALAAGMNVWAGVRGSSSRKYLQDSRIRFVELDFNDENALAGQIVRAKEDLGAWDVVIHAAGLTKSRYRHDFFVINYEGTRHFVNALRKSGAVPRQFIYLSSLSIYGAIREQAVPPHKADNRYGLQGESGELTEVVYEPIRESDVPQPNTAYGMSKAAAENFLRSLDGFPWVIFRPTGVYGPRERDYFLMAESIKKHVDFAAGMKRQEITFVYVKDLVDAIFAAIERGITQRAYLISDGLTYKSKTFSLLLQNAIGVKRVLHITAPLWLLRVVCAAAQLKSRFTGGIPTLNLDKYRIMKQRNWQCDISAAVSELGYRPRYNLLRGVGETVAWYIKEQWI